MPVCQSCTPFPPDWLTASQPAHLQLLLALEGLHGRVLRQRRGLGQAAYTNGHTEHTSTGV